MKLPILSRISGNSNSVTIVYSGMERRGNRKTLPEEWELRQVEPRNKRRHTRSSQEKQRWFFCSHIPDS
ncbi:unnamed protein product [Calypogeia fissa]